MFGKFLPKVFGSNMFAVVDTDEEVAESGVADVVVVWRIIRVCVSVNIGKGLGFVNEDCGESRNVGGSGCYRCDRGCFTRREKKLLVFS